MASSKKKSVPVNQPKAPATANVVVEKKSPLVFQGLLGLLFLVFCFMLLKNIAYPLLWNDEAETAMTAKQVMKYGYPKVHDGEKIILLPEVVPWTGYLPKYDITSGAASANCYFAVIGVWLANHYTDIYTKTALVRLPFTIMGLIGMILFVLSIRGFFTDTRSYYQLMAVFIAIELFSVSLLLHMREARYYSLVIFIVPCFLYVFNYYFILNKFSYKRYLLLMTVIFVSAYFISLPTFAVFCMSLGIFQVWESIASLLGKNSTGESSCFADEAKVFFKNLMPIIICAVLASPFIIFLQQLSLAGQADTAYGSGYEKFMIQLTRIFYILKTQEFFYPVLFVKGLHLIVWLATRNTQQKKNKSTSTEKNMAKASFFMTLFFVCYVAVVARLPFVYTRYFIVLQPLMILVMLMDSVFIFKAITGYFQKSFMGSFAKIVYIAAVLLVATINLDIKINYLTNYVYQLNNQYKGPLDYLIPFIQSKYPKTDKLVVATNYEELDYIYYLNCSIVFGFNNLKPGPKSPPDMVIYRKGWGTDPKNYNETLKTANYVRTPFPVYDYTVNNIPELDFVIKHQFKTHLTDAENEKVDIFLKQPAP